MKQQIAFKNMKLPVAMTRPGTHPDARQVSKSGARAVANAANRAGSLSGAAKRYSESMNLLVAPTTSTTPILRRELGEVLRDLRQNRGLTLRDVSARARVSLGYLSEVERGQKEASSELLASICYALDAPVSFVLREVADRMAIMEGVFVPESVPDELLECVDCAAAS